MATRTCRECLQRDTCVIFRDTAEDLGGSDTWPYRWRMKVVCTECSTESFMYMNNIEYQQLLDETS